MSKAYDSIKPFHFEDNTKNVEEQFSISTIKVRIEISVINTLKLLSLLFQLFW